MSFFENARKPAGAGGSFFVFMMNIFHTSISNWGLRNLTIMPTDIILDIGCGGGKNIARMLKRASSGKVCGLDYSAVSVAKSGNLNRSAVREGCTDIRQGSVSQNPWSDDTFDIVTAFETVYFWPDFLNDLRECLRVLKPGGRLFICNELNPPDNSGTPYQYWIKSLNLKTYTESELRKLLAEAGFSNIACVTKGQKGICVTAYAEKG
jgi:ubiquinone/menaquinone biosynthesis C-methylase UbiE